MLEEKLETCNPGKSGVRWYPKLHIAPPVGWMNDPNGLCEYHGLYHAFYQFSPFEVNAGLKFWGHCTSRDLLHWTFEGTPLVPDRPEDCHGVYSGSALVEEDGMYLYYTGNVKEDGEHDYIHSGRQANTMLAVMRDGRTVEQKELLMTRADYPSDLTCHVRDPKVWKQDDVYYMVQGARTNEDKGVVLLFSSKDKKHWQSCGRLEMQEKFGYMWECPDIYTLEDRIILSISPQGLETDGFRYANVYQSGTCFLTGDFPKKAEVGEFRELDGGFDFYAPQTFLSGDGRRIQIAWMGMPDTEDFYTNKTTEDGWQHTMTIPRELSLRNGVLCQNPVRELKEWWNGSRSFAGGFREQVDSCCELAIDTGGESIRVILEEGLELSYNKEEKIFRMEFTNPSLGAGRTMRGREVEALESLRILIDVSCVEVFLNEGEDVFSTRFYPKGDTCGIQIEGGKCSGVYLFHAE